MPRNNAIMMIIFTIGLAIKFSAFETHKILN